jgi:thiamine biosynthesis lipoprotein
MQKVQFRAMGSRILVLLDGGEAASPDPLRPVPRWFEEWEAALSRFRQESELTLLNNSHPEASAVSPILCAVIGESLRAASETDGLVNPLLLEALVAAGYDRPFDPLSTFGGNMVPGGALVVPDWHAIELDRSRCRVRLPSEGKLDLGGIAKGWAADCAAARLDREGPVLVDAGGDISAPSPMADGSPWPVGVENPFSSGAALVTIALWGGGVATSGRDYRKWISEGRAFHHLIDPRTGKPAETDVLTATVIGPSARRAEAASKAALILGSERGVEWLDRHPDFAGMLVLEDRRIIYSDRFKDYIWN